MTVNEGLLDGTCESAVFVNRFYPVLFEVGLNLIVDAYVKSLACPVLLKCGGNMTLLSFGTPFVQAKVVE